LIRSLPAWPFLVAILILQIAFFRSVKLQQDLNAGWAAMQATGDALIAQNRLIDSQKAVDRAKARVEERLRSSLPQVPHPSTFLRLLLKYFPEEPAVALAIFKNESGLRANAFNYNCFFDGDPRNGGKPTGEKTRWSWSCPKGFEHLAWSVDCGVAQINLAGRVCPKEAFEYEWSLKQARRRYDSRGWQPWTVYKDGRYKQSLEWASKLLAIRPD